MRSSPLQDGVKAWTAFMDQYLYDLTRENLMRQTADLKHVELEMLLSGITVNTAPDDYYPIKQSQMMPFKRRTLGTVWSDPRRRDGLKAIGLKAGHGRRPGSAAPFRKLYRDTRLPIRSWASRDHDPSYSSRIMIQDGDSLTCPCRRRAR